MSLYKHFDLNETGRDFIVGDIHGMFDMLRALMFKANFNPDKDRLFSVGDLVDRGPKSMEALYYIIQPWFHAVRGNHEQMCIETDAEHHRINGGDWFRDLDLQEQKEIAEQFNELPLVIDIDTKLGLIGIVHAEVEFGMDWIGEVEQIKLAGINTSVALAALWGRERIRYRMDDMHVSGVKSIYVGHTPIKQTMQINNHCYIDTGACFGNKLTMVCITTGNTFSVGAEE